MLLGRVYDMSLSHAFAYDIRHDRNSFAKALSTLLVHTLAVLPVIALSIYGLRFFPFEDPATNLVAGEHMVELTILIASSMFSMSVFAMFVADRNFMVSTIVAVMPVLIFNVLLVIDSQAGALPATLLMRQMAWAEAIGGVLALALGLLRCRDCGFQTMRPQWHYYSYGARVHWGVLFKVAVSRLDRVIVATLLPPAALAAFSIATTLRELAQTPANMYTTIYQNNVIDLKKRGKSHTAYLRKATLSWVAIMAAGCCVLYFIADPLITFIYGPALRDAAPLLVIVCVGTIGMVVAGLCWATGFSLGYPGAISIMTISAGVPSLIIMLGMTYAFGATGAAWATVVSSILMVISGYVGLMWIKRRSQSAPVTPPDKSVALEEKDGLDI
ncbi:lipopolysaccharide biosynthesis protein [Niveispirillum irakense]|uniref:lipopolysaccharide biosynthesis protein n=1 Tax=Niveispirillum irakense TaxID=34011 RepID=UPI001FE09EEC|nr:hypothetical protein [Niveispirillum irakense]